MLTAAQKQEIRDNLAKIKAQMPGFRSRAGQMTMIGAIAKALSRCPGEGTPAPASSSGAIALINGGTGVGKSLGYFLPAVLLARAKHKKLVISSSTVALQEQLAQRDLPNFSRFMGIPVKIEIAKGRSRYVCIERLKALAAAPDLAPANTSDESPALTRSDISGLSAAMVEAYDRQFWNGDRDTWHGAIDDRFWNAITTDRLGCAGRHCLSASDCAQVAARKRIKEADVVVANHDLVLADLLTGGRIIAAPESCFYIFDEAHHLHERAVSAFATNQFLGSGKRVPGRIMKFLHNAAPLVPPRGAQASRDLEMDATALGGHLADAFGFFASLAQMQPTAARPRPRIEFDLSCIPQDLREIGEQILAASDRALSQLEAIGAALAAGLDNTRPNAEAIRKTLIEAWHLIGKLRETRETWTLFLAEPPIEAPPIAKWVETVQRKRGTDFRMCASPVMAGEYLRTLLFDKAAGVVLASANLTCLGRFDECLRDAGLESCSDKVDCVDLPSPFNYREQGTLEIPAMSADPKNFEEHTAEVVAWLSGNVTKAAGEGTLVLFTSRRQMTEAARRLPPTFRSRLLIQGEMPKADILRTHTERVDAGESPVIFGLESFGEGVDLRGKYCTHVIQTKLPFSVPNDPVLKALADWIERCGGDPFARLYVPMAARKLEQHCGRLIRTETDSGRVSILDSRLWHSNYGRIILRTLPPFRLMVEGREAHPA